MSNRMTSHSNLLSHASPSSPASPLHPDHHLRPIWTLPTGLILLETSSPLYAKAYDFLVTIAEPQTRPTHLHTYLLTPYSLYAASAVSMTEEIIVSTLERLSKGPVPENVKGFIKKCTSRYGKVKLVLREGRMYVEARGDEEGTGILRTLSGNKEIAKARVYRDAKRDEERERREARESRAGAASPGARGGGGGAAGVDYGDDDDDDGFEAGLVDAEIKDNLVSIADNIDGDDESDEDGEEDETETETERLQRKMAEKKKQVSSVSFEIDPKHVAIVKKTAIDLDLPLMEEYDFRSDDSLESIPNYHLRPETRIRRYQERSLSKMFGNGRARSGIIVLPCGAGKTLTGVTASQTVGKSCVVLCTNSVSVLQWKEQFEKWTTINSGSNKDQNRIACFTSQFKDAMHDKACILITTYTMLTFSGKRNAASEAVMAQITSRTWGMLLLDEVHVVPANTFRNVIANVRAHTRLGLTATLVREDDLIADLNFLIGPKLYEANWMDLTRQGYLANVQCLEVWCPMPRSFMAEYLRAVDDARRRQMLYVMNPTKMRVVEFLLAKHEARGDKIIVFSDLVTALTYYSKKFSRFAIHGATPELEREGALGAFKAKQGSAVLFISKVGDTSIDLPEANVIIQIASHYGSRRQEAQRLGRILRPKASTRQDGSNMDGFNAFFYTCVSTDTAEMYYSTKRQQYLVDQGYTFKILPKLYERAAEYCHSKSDAVCSTKEQEAVVLSDVLADDPTLADIEKKEEDFLSKNRKDGNLAIGQFSRQKGGLTAVSGGNSGRTYQEKSGNRFFKKAKNAKTVDIFSL